MQRFCLFVLASLCLGATARGDEPLPPASVRFAAKETQEVPSLQRHVLPLLGRLGCNGRACHGSFQGQGGLRLSLFGYDFKADHEALVKGEKPRVDTQDPTESQMLLKPTMEVPHKGGKRLEVDSWEYRLITRWIQSGAAPVDERGIGFSHLEVSPAQIVFHKPGETTQLKIIAVWNDGAKEDVTPLCRFRSNDESISEVSLDGTVKSVGVGDTHIVAFYDNGVVPVQTLLPVSDKIGPHYPETPTPTKIDELIVSKLRTLGIIQSDLCGDAEFLRRVSLDITGTLPTPVEIEAFLSDSSNDKRAKKIDELLERPAYAAWWATRLCDVLGNNPNNFADRGMSDAIASHWYAWIEKRVRENQPYDKLMEGILLATSRPADQSYTKYVEEMSTLFRKEDPAKYTDHEQAPFFWMRRSFNEPAERSLAVAYAALGVRMQCAQCHKHPFDQWTQDDFNEFANFFGRVTYNVAPQSQNEYKELQKSMPKDNKEKDKLIAEGKPYPYKEVFVAPATPPKQSKNNKENKNRPKITQATYARVLGGEEVDLTTVDDPRKLLMNWLRQKDNPYFARAYVNRVWANYFGVGIIEPVDDLNLANPPSNAPLLDHLAQQFVEHNYDMKWLHRTICNSRSYQLSWKTNPTNQHDLRNFSHAQPRRLPAEVVYDALRQAVASDSELVAWEKDPMTRAIASSGTYGRTQRGNGNYSLTVFGRPARQTNCDCERSNEPSLLQTIYLRNDNEMLSVVQNGNWMRDLQKQFGVIDQEKKAENAKREQRKVGRKQIKAGIAKLEERLAEMKQKDVPLEKRAPVEQQLAKLQERLKDLKDETEVDDDKPSPPAAPANGSLPETEKLQQLVRLAFLRTVSRPPTEEEVHKAEAYLRDSDRPYEGMRDLIWALLNTKEFIVNH